MKSFSSFFFYVKIRGPSELIMKKQKKKRLHSSAVSFHSSSLLAIVGNIETNKMNLPSPPTILGCLFYESPFWWQLKLLLATRLNWARSEKHENRMARKYNELLFLRSSPIKLQIQYLLGENIIWRVFNWKRMQKSTKRIEMKRYRVNEDNLLKGWNN